jgi:hypothetical protein
MDEIIKTNKWGGGVLVIFLSVTLGKEFLYRVQWPKHSIKEGTPRNQ